MAMNRTILLKQLQMAGIRVVDGRVSASDLNSILEVIAKAPAVVDEIGKFWAVTSASPVSELEDILFETTVKDMMTQAKGGLESRELIGVFKDHAAAMKLAKEHLAMMQEDFVIKN